MERLSFFVPFSRELCSFLHPTINSFEEAETSGNVQLKRNVQVHDVKFAPTSLL